MLKKLLKKFFIRYAYKSFNKSGSKKALLSFIVHPYFFKTFKHPNIIELECIVSILEKMGYCITVVDYRRKKIHKKYDLVLGFGDCFEYAINHNYGTKFILYSTGFPAFIQNQNAIEAFFRFKQMYTEKQNIVSDKYIRLTENVWPRQLIESDAIITIGNDYVKSLYERFHDKIYCIPSTAFKIITQQSTTINSIKKNSFLWFGGKGCIHKGLDLCIAAIAGTEYKLYIAGPIDDEICIFNDILSTYPDNFEYLGFLSVNTEEFCEVVEHIPFCILPSCSEAMATSIVTLASNFGTIPLITKECGFDFDNEIIEINSLTIQSVKQALFKASLLTEDEIYIRKSSIKRKYSSYHSNESFYSKFEYSLKEILR
ncbi:TPA: glycosyltransferase family 1 protein [Escherichia coli]|uniref:glycosyltransferase family 1 protein n=4 Tax=Escherichia coli TaxID=562 RepID=UPI000B429F10|nr:glycosyltransferase family 1 protein [Escherichia coli]EGE1609528.1 glycosyltransferase family 1 protein [Escherichia coli]EIH4362645.1 glycosyltransferase family 1 protein [Escherichia coli]EIH4392744.1 glycosyltransferase family 1 protein [Escherichia coli]EMC9806516.1 glycosyltransferase family 1 protein [Escherichia coli]MBF0069422.1 glycosyltransferase family 1 protein [Escherichia coli]